MLDAVSSRFLVLAIFNLIQTPYRAASRGVTVDTWLSFVELQVRVGWVMETKEMEDAPWGTTMYQIGNATPLSY